MAKEQDALLTLKAAAQQLGVHPATLRRWADNGDILVMTTPGGHRRFPASEVTRLRGDAVGATAVASPTHTLAAQALTRTRAELAHQQEAGWLARLDADERTALRESGRRLMGLMMRFISVEDPDAGDGMLAEAVGLGHAYAETTRRAGLNLRETLHATMFFRDNIVASALLLPETAKMQPEANKRLLRRINTFLNAILQGVAEAYES